MGSAFGKRNISVLIKVWLTVIIVVAAGECLLKLCPLPIAQSRTAWLIDYQIHKLSTLPKGAVTMVGDSSLGNAVDASALSECIGSPVVNLALVGSCTTIGDYFLIKKALTNHGSLKAVILFHSIYIWPLRLHQDSKYLLEAKFEVPSYRGYLNGLVNRLELSRQSISYKSAFLQQNRGFNDRLEFISKDSSFYDFLSQDYIRQEPRNDWEHKTNIERLNRFHVDTHVEIWLDKILDICRRHNVPVYIANGPMWYNKAAASKGYIAKLMQWQKNKADQSPNMTLLYEGTPVIPSHLVGDSDDHVSPHAKDFFTSWFCKMVKSKMIHIPDAESGPHHPTPRDSILLFPFQGFEKDRPS